MTELTLLDHSKNAAKIMRIIVDGGFMDSIMDELWFDADFVDGEPNEEAKIAAFVSLTEFYLMSLEASIIVADLENLEDQS